MTPEREAEIRKEFEARYGPDCDEAWAQRWHDRWQGYLSAHTDSQMARSVEALRIALAMSIGALVAAGADVKPECKAFAARVVNATDRSLTVESAIDEAIKEQTT